MDTKKNQVIKIKSSKTKYLKVLQNKREYVVKLSDVRWSTHSSNKIEW